MIQLNFTNNTVYSNDPKAYTLEKSNYFGTKEGNKIEFSLFEGLYLVETKKAELLQNTKKLNEEEIEKKFSKIDKKFQIKYSVYNDLRSKGYIPKTGLKFGGEFRVYEKGKGPGKDHSKWIVFTESEKNYNSWTDFTAKNRVAHSTNKKLLLAIVDDENNVSYFEVNWVKI